MQQGIRELRLLDEDAQAGGMEQDKGTLSCLSRALENLEMQLRQAPPAGSICRNTQSQSNAYNRSAATHSDK